MAGVDTMIICKKCGNTEGFTKDAEYEEIAEETHIINGETEEIIDYIEKDTTHSEMSRYLEETITCKNCDAVGTRYIKEGLKKQEILEIKLYHLDEEGIWHKDGISEKQSNIEVKKELLALRL
jgi:hypothetical protein